MTGQLVGSGSMIGRRSTAVVRFQIDGFMFTSYLDVVDGIRLQSNRAGLGTAEIAPSQKLGSEWTFNVRGVVRLPL